MLTMTIMIEDHIAGLLPRKIRSSCTIGTGYLVVRKELPKPSSLLDVLGSMGIPPCEIGRIAMAHDQREVDPASPAEPDMELVIEAAVPRLLDDPRFICDGHLGKLAVMLRVMGFDTAWDDGWNEAGLARRGVNEKRVVLSRSRSLLKRRTMTRAQLIRSDRPDTQAAEVLHRFMLADRVRMFGRCSRCNGMLKMVPKADVAPRIPPLTARWLNDYYICLDCDHLFWEGTHVTALRRRVSAILQAATESRP